MTSHDIDELAPPECLRLLDTAPVGRMVFLEGALPVAHPVNFLRHGSSVIVRTGPGAKLDAARRRDLVAFEADHIDPDTHTGWSVLLVGRAEVVNDVDQLLAVLDLAHRPWVRGRGAHVLRITAQRITGRRLVRDGGLDGTAHTDP
ncbi:pyridoxamine 5'-phosphate oxidase family protein [Actinomycetospora chlora]|uniref:Pyridoxamine 5'-phosphate oxidase family protein n=1 Tax=Actinomycetospora chlora TaxID=663608 RepID=A0ABP9AMR2_9PSEU